MPITVTAGVLRMCACACVCVCAHVSVSTISCHEAVCLGVFMPKCHQTGRWKVQGWLLDIVSKASYWRNPCCIYMLSTNRLLLWSARERNKMRPLVLCLFVWVLCPVCAALCVQTCVCVQWIMVGDACWEHLLSSTTHGTWGMELWQPHLGWAIGPATPKNWSYVFCLSRHYSLPCICDERNNE